MSANNWVQHRTPYCLAPALILVIHNARISLFLFRLSLYAYCKPFSTLSLAILMQFFARPLKPLASFRILSLFILYIWYYHNEYTRSGGLSETNGDMAVSSQGCARAGPSRLAAHTGLVINAVRNEQPHKNWLYFQSKHKIWDEKLITILQYIAW